MAQETQKEIWTPYGGVDYETNSTRLASTVVQAAVNTLFERMTAKSRPGFSTTPATGVVGPIVFVDKVVCNAVQYSIYINIAGNLYYVASGIGSGQINGPGTTFGPVQYHNITSIDGLIVIGNNTGGLISWDPTNLANNYTIITGAPYRYVCGQQGRAVAAYQISGGSQLVNARTFAWSKPGDITTWTSVDGSAGNSAIAEIFDEITGLGVLHNIVVLPRRYGIHLGYPTGTLPLPYSVQSFILDGNGNWWPETAAWSDELLLCVGEDNVYQFDLQNMTPIGNQIRAELLTNLNNGITYRGFMQRYGSSYYPRYRYHLFPVGASSQGLAHFSFDIKDQTWSRHTYTSQANWAWNFPSPASEGLGDFGMAYVDSATNPPNVNYWNTSVACEANSSWTKYAGDLQSLEQDLAIEDVIIHYQDVSATPVSVTCSITGQGSQGPQTTNATINIGGTNDQAWKRAKFSASSSSPLRQVGNDFVVTCTAAAGANFIMDQMVILTTPQGDYRG